MSGSHAIAIVFDLDNTLVHSKINFPAMRQRVIDVVRDSDLQVQHDAPLTSLATAEVIELGLQHGAAPEMMAQIWTAVTEEETLGMELASVEDDAADVLHSLKSTGVGLAVLTNNARRAAAAALERFDLLHYLDVVLGRDDVSALKPSPAGLLHAVKILAPTSVAMVGDASIDGIAANRAGVPFIAFRPTVADMERRGVERWATIHDLSEIATLLPRLRDR